jgi:chemotaxis protein methyltransferase CheR
VNTGAHPHDLAVADGEFAFTWSDFRQIAELVHSEAGIVLTETKANLVYSRLAKRLRAIGLRSFREYCALIEGSDGADERQAMIAAMTTNVTRFFREAHHFDYLKKHILSNLQDAIRKGYRVRIWSAGASSGEEAYSIAVTVLEAIPEAAEQDVLILATDIDPEMLRRGEAGIYQARQFGDVPADIKKKWFRSVARNGEAEFEVAPELRALVRFKELNLLHEWPMTGRFDVIFCRNVMIYFDEPMQNEVWRRFARQLPPGGLLCIGHSERIVGATLPFELVGQTVYRRKGATS